MSGFGGSTFSVQGYLETISLIVTVHRLPVIVDRFQIKKLNIQASYPS
jgi:hypothetical protein